MSNPNVGYAAVRIIPSAKGFKSALNKEISPDLRAVGEKSGKEFGTGLKSSARKAGSDAGEETAKGFRDKFKGQIGDLGSELKTQLSSPFAAAALVAGAAVAIKSVVAEASNLDESINAVNVTFGESADKILDFGENAAKSVGLAKTEFNQLATPLGSILKNAGFGLDETADKTIILTQRAADMASVFNTDVSEALGAIQAGLRGEQDPLERFGVGLSAAKVEARALADTGKETAKQLTDQEKQLARVEIILDQTNQTAGDFANTSEGLANQTRILNAEFKNLQARGGKVLIPVLSDVAAELQLIIEAAELAGDALAGIPGLGDGGGGGFKFNPFQSPLGIMRDTVENVGKAWKGVSESQAIAGGGMAVLAGHARNVADAATEAADGLGALDDEATDLGPRWAAATIPLEGATGALAEMRSQADLVRDAIVKETDEVSNSERAHQLLADAVKAVRDAMFDSLDTMFDYEGAVAATFFAAADFKNALENTPEDLWAVREAEIAAAEAALQQAEDFAAAAGATEDSTVKAQLMVLELENLQEKFPELEGVIQGYIDTLNRIPGVVETQLLITAEGRGYTAQLTNPFGRIIDAVPSLDTGGFVTADGLAMVHRGEIVTAAEKVSAAGGGFGGAGVIVNIEGPVYGHLLPEMIVDGVTQAARQNGAQWLRDLVDA